MQNLIKQEQFEIEVLDRLNSGRFLGRLVFIGGTMLRLCFGLERFSVDLDFWIVKEINDKKFFEGLKKYLEKFYIVKDSACKFYTMLFELKSRDYPRSLKIEIRKGLKEIKTEPAIAYSKYTDIQVLLKTLSLQDAMRTKVDAFLKRKEIRDIFDIEFLYKRGSGLEVEPKKLEKLLNGIGAFAKKDYSVKLGSLLEEKMRRYYTTENFKILKTAIKGKLGEDV